jgi:carboxypeptidase C (cathepsin A)
MITYILLGLTLSHLHAQPAEDQVHSLPDGTYILRSLVNLTEYGFRIYSGYLQADPKRQLHYIFVESQNNQTRADTPLALWLNGGPGIIKLNH